MADNVLIGDSSESLFSNLINEFESYYGKDNVDIEVSPDDVTIIVYFPSIVISNISQSRILYDLYARLFISNSLYNCSYARTTFSEKELACGYVHSHCTKHPSIQPSMPLHEVKRVITSNPWHSVCLGHSTAFEVALSETRDSIRMGTPISPFLAIGLAQALDTAVRWESLDGGPFLQLASVRDVSIEGASPTGISPFIRNYKLMVRNPAKLVLADDSNNRAIDITTLGFLLADTILPWIPTYFIGYNITKEGNKERLSDYYINCSKTQLNQWILRAIHQLNLTELLPYILVTHQRRYPKFDISNGAILDFYQNLNNANIPLFNFQNKPKYLKVYNESLNLQLDSLSIPQLYIIDHLSYVVYQFMIYLLQYERINIQSTAPKSATQSVTAN